MPPANKSGKSNKLSRKQLQQLKDYGELDPLSSAIDEGGLDDAIGKALGRSGYGQFTGKFRAGKVTEKRINGRGRPSLAKSRRSARPDAYSRLLNSLSSTAGSIPAASSEAIVSDDEDMDEDLAESEESGADIAAGSASDEDGDNGEGMQSGTEDGDTINKEYGVDEVDNDELESGDGDDMEPEDVAASEPREAYEAHDYMESHYTNVDSEKLHKKLAAVTNKEYQQSVVEDEVFGPAAIFDVAGESMKPANPQPLKQKLIASFHALNKSSQFSSFQQRLFNWFDQYRDVAFVGRSMANEDELTTTYALHALNHVMKAKDREHKNSSKLAKAHAAGKDAGELRDRGFTRPRVLIILPFRNDAYKLVGKLLKLLSTKQEMNLSRFTKEYGPDSEEERRHNANQRKPEDFRRTFAGNIDDAFRIGLQLHNKSVKLYADFYRADIIIASPIGLRMTTGAESGDRKDFDFLSSIEMVIMDQCDTLLMQNWDHVAHMFAHMNLMPKKDHGCDFSRVRSWCLDGMAQYRRQTILLSEYMTPEIQAAFNNHCRSIEGKVRVKPAYTGSINDVVAQVKQVFKRVSVRRLASASDDRFSHFIEQTLPELEKTELSTNHTVIFASSYFDFVRIRNHCKDKGLKFVAISEYSTKSEAMRARLKLHAGELQFILYSERAHFYYRYPIKGIRHMVFYSLPDHPHYYSELVNLMLNGNDESVAADELSCTAFYSKFDQLKLERVVGTKLALQLLSGDRSQFTFA
ncbi:rRNA-binding ribosome biosynthesis protein utp25 [Coemansia sp. RSA 2706]|nr:rRNA-binding ribosome biosynthesis protein utp25 [Coemansia sp. RSA 2706]KAJ2369667.1 rRNA-binding ribosome biosynthesis protein utp25 [Coemansia sp. RSA 2610]